MKIPNIPAGIKVSVIAANYNNGRYLDEFLFSIENSSILPDEVIIVDDFSTDNSVTILKGYKGNLNLKNHFSEKHIGFSDALNIAVRLSEGNYLLRIDPDDIIHPSRIETQLNYLLSYRDSGIVGCNVFYFKTNPQRPVFKSNVPCRKESILKSLQQGDIPLIHSGIMGKREVFEKFPYKKSQFPVEDYRFFSELAIQKVSMANIPDYLTYVRIHDGSISSKLEYGRTKEIFKLRNEYFGKRICRFQLLKSYLHLKFYRQFLASDNFLKWFWLLLAAAANPIKIIQRLSQR
jgi:glycosyltransferase involved in cell wall biosynthesis